MSTTEVEEANLERMDFAENIKTDGCHRSMEHIPDIFLTFIIYFSPLHIFTFEVLQKTGIFHVDKEITFCNYISKSRQIRFKI